MVLGVGFSAFALDSDYEQVNTDYEQSCADYEHQFIDYDKPSAWATDQVNMAIEKNLVPLSLQSAYTQAITRAEFASLVVTLYEKRIGEIAGRVTFSDTTDANVEKVAYIGVVLGVGYNMFGPDIKLTREQAAVMLARLADVLGRPFPLWGRGLHPSVYIADYDMISSWAIENVAQIYQAGIMTGVGDRNFAPTQPYTREQSIITILRMIDNVTNNATNKAPNNVVAFEKVEIYLAGQRINSARLAEMVTSGEIPANVTHLNLAVNIICNISPLSNLTNLVELNLWGNYVRDVSYLQNLTSLTKLNLWGNEFDDISMLGNLTNLTSLSVGDNLNFNGDLSVLRNFTELTMLGLGDTWQNRMDFSHIEALTNLESLQLWAASMLHDLSIIENHTNLTRLTIHASSVTDFSPLSNLTKLTFLDLQHNWINCISVIPFEYLVNLRELNLWKNEITQEQLGELRRALPNVQIRI